MRRCAPDVPRAHGAAIGSVDRRRRASIVASPRHRPPSKEAHSPSAPLRGPLEEPGPRAHRSPGPPSGFRGGVIGVASRACDLLLRQSRRPRPRASARSPSPRRSTIAARCRSTVPNRSAPRCARRWAWPVLIASVRLTKQSAAEAPAGSARSFNPQASFTPGAAAPCSRERSSIVRFTGDCQPRGRSRFEAPK